MDSYGNIFYYLPKTSADVQNSFDFSGFRFFFLNNSGQQEALFPVETILQAKYAI